MTVVSSDLIAVKIDARSNRRRHHALMDEAAERTDVVNESLERGRPGGSASTSVEPCHCRVCAPRRRAGVDAVSVCILPRAAATRAASRLPHDRFMVPSPGRTGPRTSPNGFLRYGRSASP